MGEALAEARNALARGERPIAAVAVVDEAMVARAHDRVQESNDPTAHAVVVALRETARKLGKDRLASATIFATLEPCSMCVGALLAERRRDARLRRPEHRRRCRRHGHPARPASGARPAGQDRQRDPPGRGRGAVRGGRHRTLATSVGRHRRRGLWYPLPRRGVRVVDGAALEKRCAKAPRVRIPPSPPGLISGPADR